MNPLFALVLFMNFEGVWLVLACVNVGMLYATSAVSATFFDPVTWITFAFVHLGGGVGLLAACVRYGLARGSSTQLKAAKHFTDTWLYLLIVAVVLSLLPPVAYYVRYGSAGPMNSLETSVHWFLCMGLAPLVGSLITVQELLRVSLALER